eukprot:8056573-Karenia_brevis.AAC.1
MPATDKNGGEGDTDGGKHVLNNAGGDDGTTEAAVADHLGGIADTAVHCAGGNAGDTAGTAGHNAHNTGDDAGGNEHHLVPMASELVSVEDAVTDEELLQRCERAYVLDQEWVEPTLCGDSLPYI